MGNEEEIRRVIEEEKHEYVDEIDIDVMGNLIAYKKGNGQGKRLCFLPIWIRLDSL